MKGEEKMNQTTNYGFNVPIGSDIVNPLVQDFPNWESLDTLLRNIANTGITTATHTKTGTIHTLSFIDTTVPMIRFQATADFNTNDTFTVNGLSVSALTVAGESLPDGAFVIGSMVLCELRDNLLTVYSSGSDASTLDGHPASYFATASDLQTVDGKANANKILIDQITADLTWKHIGDSAGSNVGGSESAVSVSKTYREIAIVISPNPTSNKQTNVMVIPMIALTSLSNYAQPRQLTGGHYYTPTAGANSLSYGINATSNDNNFDIKVDWMASNGADKSHEYYLQVYAR